MWQRFLALCGRHQGNGARCGKVPGGDESLDAGFAIGGRSGGSACEEGEVEGTQRLASWILVVRMEKSKTAPTKPVGAAPGFVMCDERWGTTRRAA
jgi:hypothetical protein